MIVKYKSVIIERLPHFSCTKLRCQG